MWVSRREYEDLRRKVEDWAGLVSRLRDTVEDRHYGDSYNGPKVIPGLTTRVNLIEEALKLNLPTHVPEHWELNRKGKTNE